MSMLNTSNSWNVGRASPTCAGCGKELPASSVCWAALCDGLPAKKRAGDAKSEKTEKAKKEAAEPPSPFVRVDFCETCWAQGRRPEQLSPESLGLVDPGVQAKLTMFSYWKTTVQPPQQKKKLLVDDNVLMDVFQRMEGKTDPQEVRFRFVLALILMRKRLLKYEATEESAMPADPAAPRPPETWRMLPKVSGDTPGGAGGTWGAAVHVINPHLTEQQIAEVSQQLSAILAEEV